MSYAFNVCSCFVVISVEHFVLYLLYAVVDKFMIVFLLHGDSTSRIKNFLKDFYGSWFFFITLHSLKHCPVKRTHAPLFFSGQLKLSINLRTDCSVMCHIKMQIVYK